MKRGTRVTQKEIAKKAGVTIATVSMALREDPRLPEATRHRIQKWAIKLGYRPDPLLSALSSYRQNGGPPKHRGVIAFLKDDFAKVTDYSGIVYSGAERYAEKMGYRIESFSVNDPEIRPERLTQIFVSRGIEGLIFGVRLERNFYQKFGWENFSSVTVTRALDEPKLHLVNPNQTTGSRRVWDEVIGRGYKRIGIVLEERADNNVQHRFSFQFWGEQKKSGSEIDKLPLLFLAGKRGNQEAEKQRFTKWFKRHQPEVIISYDSEPLCWIKEMGKQIPEEVGFACIKLNEGQKGISGNVQAVQQVGDSAVQFLDSIIRSGERGIPKHHQTLLLDGYWVEGRTLRKKNSY
ncbi:MAG: LacI family DNA-binding transcriptional regulator [Verrucomicrobiota bacterium]